MTLLLASAILLSAKGKPNIIVIVANDLGYSDLGVYGSEINTHNLDLLAEEGVIFKEFYNTSVGNPSKAAILTGRYPHQAGVGYFFGGLGVKGYEGHLNIQSLTIGEVLRHAGYTTLHAGEWGVAADGKGYPLERGFDHSFLSESGGSYFDQKEVSYTLDSKPFSIADGSYYLTDLITDQAIRFVKEARQGKKPFFLYLSYTAPHWPLHAPADDVNRYRGKFDTGYQTLREKRLSALQKSGIIDSCFKLPKKEDDVYIWKRVAYNMKHLLVKRQEVYAAQIDRLDQNIGRLRQLLQDEGVDNNTVVIFLSDNGAPSEDIVRWHRGAIRNQATVGTAGSFESIGKEWAYLSNSPLRGYKDQLYEGGISSPLIVWGAPGQQRGAIVKGIGHVIDIAPTVYAIAGASYPKKYQGQVTGALEGVSLLPVITGRADTVSRTAPLFWEHAGNRAVRRGDWKIVNHYPNYEWSLYNISNDRGETNDLASKHPKLLQTLATEYYEWAQQNNIEDFNTLKPLEPDTLFQLRRSRHKNFRTNNR